jgi:hypothetical protein
MHVYQIIGAVSSIVNLCVFAYYFLNLSIEEKKFISTKLREDFAFRFVVSFNIGLQCILFILFFLKFRIIKLPTCITGIVFVIISFSGWCILASNYTDPSHLIGFVVYTTGLGVYWVIIYVFDRIEFLQEKQNYIFFLSSSVFVVLYCIFYLLNDPTSFMYEHIAMILYSCANVYFFTQHDPDPCILVEAPVRYTPMEYT